MTERQLGRLMPEDPLEREKNRQGFARSMGFLIDTCVWIAVERGLLAPADVATLTNNELCLQSPSPNSGSELRLRGNHENRLRQTLARHGFVIDDTYIVRSELISCYAARLNSKIVRAAMPPRLPRRRPEIQARIHRSAVYSASGTSRSRQILRARKSLISRCRGIVEDLPLARFT